jgi:hypothetical protein
LRGSPAHPRVQHLAAIGAGGQDRVVATPLRVAEPGALLGVAVDLANRRVDIDVDDQLIP